MFLTVHCISSPEKCLLNKPFCKEQFIIKLYVIHMSFLDIIHSLTWHAYRFYPFSTFLLAGNLISIFIYPDVVNEFQKLIWILWKIETLYLWIKIIATVCLSAVEASKGVCTWERVEMNAPLKPYMYHIFGNKKSINFVSARNMIFGIWCT